MTDSEVLAEILGWREYISETGVHLWEDKDGNVRASGLLEEDYRALFAALHVMEGRGYLFTRTPGHDAYWWVDCSQWDGHSARITEEGETAALLACIRASWEHWNEEGEIVFRNSTFIRKGQTHDD